MPSELMQWFTSGGALAVLGFVMWWLLQKFIPDMQAVFAGTIKDIQATHAKAMQDARQDYLGAIQRETDTRKERDQAVIQALAANTGAISSLENKLIEHDTAMKIAHAIELQGRGLTDRAMGDLGKVATVSTKVGNDGR